MKDCPCGGHFPYTDCCGPLIRGTGFADTAEDLMRSRFTAYTLKDWNYLIATTASEERADLTSEQLETANETRRWTRLEVLGSDGGSAQDDEGEVEFAAYYREGESEGVLRETSRFFRENNRWVYSQKESIVHKKREPAAPAKPFVRKEAKVGRNDPCSCGSGKKYKKCCGR